MIQNDNMLVTMTIGQLRDVIKEVVSLEFEKLKNNTEIEKKETESTLLTREQTADLLKVSLTTLYHWNNSKILIASKISRRVYYRKEDVLNLLKNGFVGGV